VSCIAQRLFLFHEARLRRSQGIMHAADEAGDRVASPRRRDPSVDLRSFGPGIPGGSCGPAYQGMAARPSRCLQARFAPAPSRRRLMHRRFERGPPGVRRAMIADHDAARMPQRSPRSFRLVLTARASDNYRSGETTDQASFWYCKVLNNRSRAAGRSAPVVHPCGSCASLAPHQVTWRPINTLTVQSAQFGLPGLSWPV
jgi:hypothetical protein